MNTYKKIASLLLCLCLLFSLSACENKTEILFPLGSITYSLGDNVMFVMPTITIDNNEDRRNFTQKYAEAYNEYVKYCSKNTQGSEMILIYLEYAEDPRLIASYDTDLYSADEIALLMADFRKAIEEYENIDDYQKFGKYLERTVKKFEKSKK